MAQAPLKMNTQESLQKLGYAVVPAVLSEDEIRTAKSWFHEWLDSVNIPQSMRTHGIFKHHEVGGTRSMRGTCVRDPKFVKCSHGMCGTRAWTTWWCRSTVAATL